jgi:hypothetical protein
MNAPELLVVSVCLDGEQLRANVKCSSELLYVQVPENSTTVNEFPFLLKKLHVTKVKTVSRNIQTRQR